MVLLFASAVLVRDRAIASNDAGQPELQLRERTYHGVPFDVVEVPLDRHVLHVTWRAGGARLKNVGGVVRMNAGIFEPGYLPSGLLVSSGTQRFGLNRGAGSGNFYLKPNGVFGIRGGRAFIAETSGFDGGEVSEATQSGPLLLHNGQAHPAFDPHSNNTVIRNGVGVRDPAHVVLVISRAPVNLWTLATFFKEELGCQDALYLDGAISGLWAANSSRPAELKKGPFAGILTVD